MAEFEVPVNIATSNFDLGEHLSVIVVVEADDAESATKQATRHVGQLLGGVVYGVEAEFPED